MDQASAIHQFFTWGLRGSSKRLTLGNIEKNRVVREVNQSDAVHIAIRIELVCYFYRILRQWYVTRRRLTEASFPFSILRINVAVRRTLRLGNLFKAATCRT